MTLKKCGTSTGGWFLPCQSSCETAAHMCVVACRSAEMRDTEGGASSRSVLEQVEKLKQYLADEQL